MAATPKREQAPRAPGRSEARAVGALLGAAVGLVALTLVLALAIVDSTAGYSPLTRWLFAAASLAVVMGPTGAVVVRRAKADAELRRVESERDELASEREKLLTEVAVLARSDVLTGLPNRRGLDEQLPREMARARRAEAELCLAIVDMDHFKAYNDAHGHLAGDTMLRDCAVAWDSELRGEDTIVRFGGEEFLVVLPDCPLEQAAEIVERLRAATPDGQTCSAGLACWDYSETAVDLVDRADSALYRAKAAGRDQLVRAPRIES